MSKPKHTTPVSQERNEQTALENGILSVGNRSGVYGNKRTDTLVHAEATFCIDDCIDTILDMFGDTEFHA